MKNQGKSGYNQLEGVSAERLAAFLGISDAELYSLKTKVTPVKEDDGTIGAFMLEFATDAPAKVLNKISRLVNGRYVYVLIDEIRMSEL